MQASKSTRWLTAILAALAIVGADPVWAGANAPTVPDVPMPPAPTGRAPGPAGPNQGGAAPPAADPSPSAPGAASQPTPPAPGAGAEAGDVAAQAAAVAKSESDWPCVQAKVHTIDSAAVWDGPSLEGLAQWSDDNALSDVARSAISRRTPLPEAEKSIEAYAKSLPETERDQKLTLLFAGVLDTANMQRNSIIGGIERYQKRQRSNAQEIEKQGEAIAELESKAPSDLTIPTPELDTAREKYDWFTRVFQERQGNIPIACEIPTLIEQRVFAISRAIRAQMKS
jgi:hypothetical protein